MSKPILAPDALPYDVRRVLVGLNPKNASVGLAKVESFAQRALEVHYP